MCFCLRLINSSNVNYFRNLGATLTVAEKAWVIGLCKTKLCTYDLLICVSRVSLTFPVVSDPKWWNWWSPDMNKAETASCESETPASSSVNELWSEIVKLWFVAAADWAPAPAGIIRHSEPVSCMYCVCCVINPSMFHSQMHHRHWHSLASGFIVTPSWHCTLFTARRTGMALSILWLGVDPAVCHKPVLRRNGNGSR